MRMSKHRRRLAGLLLGCCALHASASAQTTEPPPQKLLPAELFFKDADVAEAVLSPSGRSLALTMARAGSRVGLFVIDLVGGQKVKRAAQFVDVDVRDVAWVNEERLVFSATDYSEGSGRPDGAPGLFAVNPDGSEARELVKRKKRIVSYGADLGRALEWNHRLLRVPVPRPGEPNEEVLVGELGLRGAGRPLVHPRWLNVRTGRSRSTGFDAPSDAVGWLFDSRGDARVVFTQREQRQAAYWRGPGRSDWQLLVEGELLDMSFTPHTVDDAGNLFVTRREGPAGQQVLARYDFERKAPSAEPLVRTPGFDFTGQLMLERGSGAAQGVRVTTDAETTVWFDEGLKRLQALVDDKLPGRVNRISCRQCGQPDAVALIRSYSDRDPGTLLLYRAAPTEGQAQWQLVMQLRPGLDERQMARVDLQRIRARDGRDLPVWLTLPRGVEPGKPAPTVVLVHGGPWVRGGRWAWQAMQQFLASRGYLVIEPEFRGSTGYGEAHFRAGWKQWGQAMQDDVADALLWARQQGLANERACIAGASYGGYSTLMGLVRQPELYRCGIAWVAVSDLELYLKGSWWIGDDISDLGRKYTLPEMVGDPEKDAGLLARSSPVLLADKIKAPLLLAYGEDDQRVPLAHGERLRAALQKAGNEPEWVSYPGEGHGFGLLKHKLDFAQRVERFLAKQLLDEAR